MDIEIGRKGLLGYLKAIGGSNIVKVIPSSGSASELQATGKGIKVICGNNTSYLAANDWIGDNTPLTLCEVRVSPKNSVTPNVGASELAEALNRVLPFTATEDNRPVLQCVNFIAKDGKLTLVGADGFRLAIVNLDYDGEGQALINRIELKGVASALKQAKRAKISFESEDVTKPSSLVIDTELIRYKWASQDGAFPEYGKVIPTEFSSHASFDTVEAIKAANSLKALSTDKDYAIDLAIAGDKIVMTNPDNKGQAELPASADGQGKIRVNGGYLTSVLKACGGMVEFKLTNAYSPMLFSQNGYQVVVMPMMTNEANEQAEAESKAKAEPEATEQAEAEQVAEPEATEPVAEKPKGKGKRSRAKEPATV